MATARSLPATTAANRSRRVGLGLAIVTAVVEAHGGSIEVDSKLGRGTTVRVTLPESSGADATIGA